MTNRSATLYWLEINDKQFEVCRKAFLSIYAITDERVKRIRKLVCNGQTPKDGSGKSQSVNAMLLEEIVKITQHIRSFPIKESHYVNRTMHYLHSELCVKKMYQLFIGKHPNSPVKDEYCVS